MTAVTRVPARAAAARASWKQAASQRTALFGFISQLHGVWKLEETRIDKGVRRREIDSHEDDDLWGQFLLMRCAHRSLGAAQRVLRRRPGRRRRESAQGRRRRPRVHLGDVRGLVFCLPACPALLVGCAWQGDTVEATSMNDWFPDGSALL